MIEDEKDEGDNKADDRECKILLVDDQVFNLILLENLIVTNFPNALIDKALNGKIALDMVLEQDDAGSPFELIFMDINMPEMDGFESSRLINQSYKDGKLAFKPYIAAITAYTSEAKKQ